MDKRVVFWVCTAGISLLLLGRTALLDTLLAFCILGIIPGTTIVLPSWLIMTAYPLVFLTLIYWLMSQSFFIGDTTPADVMPIAKKTPHKTAKQAVPKRRPRTAI